MPAKYKKSMIGLCGDCNGVKDDIKTKGGIDVSMLGKKLSMETVARSYQVHDNTNNAPVQ